MPAWLVARVTLLEALRKKDFYALLILLGLYALIARVITQQYPDDENAIRLLFSLGLTFGFGSSAILVVALGARQINKDIEQGTILPLLARPLTRGHYIFGKFLACWLVGVGSLLCFIILIRSVVAAPNHIGGALLFQAVALKAVALAALAAMTLLLSLFIPVSLNMAFSLGYYFLWGIVFTAFETAFKMAGGPWDGVVGRALYVLPHFEVLNISRVCLMQPNPIDWGLAISLAAYGLGYALVALMTAWNVFERRWV